MEFMGSLKPNDIMHSPLILHPGTKAYETGLKDKVIDLDSWADYMVGKKPMPTYLPKDMTAEEVGTLIFEANKRFYLTPKKIADRIIRSKTPSELGNNTLAAAAYLIDSLH
jgi:hypothetical protein